MNKSFSEFLMDQDDIPDDLKEHIKATQENGNDDENNDELVVTDIEFNKE